VTQDTSTSNSESSGFMWLFNAGVTDGYNILIL
jgi:hypothetical protein